jgi:arylsulfatase A-like enzyme
MFPRLSRQAFALVLGLLAVALLSPSVQAQDDDEPLNVLLIIADDYGYMDSTAYNPDTFYDTPNLQRLAETGMRFTEAYVANPVCSPTRYSLMAGKYPSRHDATNWFAGRRHERFRSATLNAEMPVEEETIGEAFQDEGYTTFFAGKWHLGPDPKHWPENQGFDINKGGHSIGRPPGGYFSPYDNPRLESGPDGEYLPFRLADETSQFLEDHQDEPFLAVLSFHEVHNPRQAPDELVEKYIQKRKRLGLDSEDEFDQDNSSSTVLGQKTLDDSDKFEEIEQVWPDRGPRQERVVQSHPVYAAMVDAMDQAIGRVLDRLEGLGLRDNTMVVFISDHGGLSTSEGHNTSNRPLRGGKGWIYEGGIRTPFLVRWPGVTEPGSVTNVPIMSTDLYPTFLDAANLPLKPDQHVDGESFVSVLKGGGEEDFDREPLYWHYPHYSNQGGPPAGAIRVGPWKLVERYEQGSVELYNVRQDLEEQNDLAEEYPDRVKRMRQQLHDWYQEVDAKFLRPYEDEDDPEPWRPDYMQ